MLIGRKEAGAGALIYRRGSPGKKGFTLIELTVTAAIIMIISGILVLSLKAGDTSVTVGMAEADLQGRIRIAADMIVNDVRQTNRNQIDTNNPSQDYIRFQKVIGIDDSTGGYNFSDAFIEYNYTAGNRQLKRSEIDGSGNVLSMVTFHNITGAPFYADAGMPLNASSANYSSSVYGTSKLYIVLNGEDVLKNGITLTYSLNEDAKIRNP